MQLDLFEIHNIISNEPTDTNECRLCKNEKDASEFYIIRTVLSHHKSKETIKVYYDNRCKECCKSIEQEKKALKKKHRYPDSNVCDCCGIICTEKLMFDHCHDKLIWRGWLCRSCNVGIGMLGDNISGLKQAIEYLKKVEGR
jgi:hypothetical protein